MSAREVVAHVTREARAVLEGAWVEEAGCCRPNENVYPHQWLWDSCFHAIAWGSMRDIRGVRELTSALSAQFDDGLVPHMRYLGSPGAFRGPQAGRSSFTQPPVFSHAAAYLERRGFGVPPAVGVSIARALQYLYDQRRTPDGLIFIVHPWESGADDSPRWDGWISESYENHRGWRYDSEFVDCTEYSSCGSAKWNHRFVVAPAGFNALTAHAFAEFGAHTKSKTWSDRAHELAATMDRVLWDDGEGLWSDLVIVGPDTSVAVPTLDGALPALVTSDASRAQRVLEQLEDPRRFAAPFGLTYTARDHSSFDPVGYWRGAAWPHLNYLMWLVAERWGQGHLSAQLRRQSLEAAIRSRFAEYWNPLTGEGLGAVPQAWAAIAVAFADATRSSS